MTGESKPFSPDNTAEIKRLEAALEAAGVGTWELDLPTKRVRWCERCKALFGFLGENVVSYEQMLALIHPDDQGRLDTAVQWALNSQSNGQFDTEFRTVRANDGQVRWLQVKGKAYFNERGEPSQFSGIVQSITQKVQTRQQMDRNAEQLLESRAYTDQIFEKIAESEAKLRSVIATAPAAMGLFVGRDLIVELPNQAFIDIVGKGPDIVGRPLREVMPELENQAFLQILDDVYTSGNMFQSFGTQVNIVQHGVMTHNFYNITYTPLLDADGKVYAILDIAIDVTEEIKARQAVEESELFARMVFDNSPIAKIVFAGETMVIRTVNQRMLAMLGRDASIIGQPFMEAMPELLPTPLMDRLRQVFTTGETYYQPEEKLELIRFGQPYTGYYDYIYKALHNTAGNIYGIICTAVEITDQVLARQKIEEAQRTLRGAVELAELGTWSLNLTTGLLDYSERLREWFGIGPYEVITIERAYRPIREADRPLVKAAIQHAITSGTDGVYDVEYTVEAAQAGRERILHAQGLAYFTEQGRAYKISGTVQDITVQRQLQLALEQEVQERTEELESTNEELAAINEELSESNDLLSRSNENLQQFAYVASHDLQEPLRKIQQFGDLLANRYAHELGEGVDYLERMQTAASRMSTLIRDLLTFSRISTQRDTSTWVQLRDIVQTVVNDLELRIQETGAVVQIEELPRVQGDSLQLGQLFQNLLSNALKFRRTDPSGVLISPQIRISAQRVAATDLSATVKPGRAAKEYHRIDVSDNGIGFNEKYIDRIFQVFQRLHGKNEFAGTGIGLAICEKVATNHGGAISARSQPGQGATFSVYLPD